MGRSKRRATCGAEASVCSAITTAAPRSSKVNAAGDPHWITFTRSTLKPLQALPFVHAGGLQHFGLSAANLALLCVFL